MIKLPNTLAPIADAVGRILAPWTSYLQQFTQAPPNIMPVVVTASPFAYKVQEPGSVTVTGGTVSVILLTRGSISINLTGQKIIPVSINDTITVTYSVLPIINFIPAYGQNTNV
jgi:hypothetical protein